MAGVAPFLRTHRSMQRHPNGCRHPRSRVRFVLAALVGSAVLTACEDPRLPLEYMRRTATPPGLAGAGIYGSEDPGAVRSLVDQLPPPVAVGWDSIVARDTLRVILTFNSTGYFIYRGEPMGFEYDLLEAFADHHDLELQTRVVSDRRDLLRALNLGEGDVVASRLVASAEYRDEVLVTRPLYQTRAVVVQREPGAPLPADDRPPPLPVDSQQLGQEVELNARLLRNPAELAGEEVFMPAGSDYYDRIVELADSVGDAIELVEVEGADEVEPLIEAVARGQIRLTVSHENLAELSKGRFTNIVATPVLGEEEDVTWAVRRTSPELLAELDTWLVSSEGQRLLSVLYTKYYVDRQAYRTRLQDDLMIASSEGQISEYDSLLIRYAEDVGWDWRLLAAQVAQESRFDPVARSWAGAQGLLQLMPRTAREMGVTNPRDPEDNVRGGVKYLSWLTGLWSDEIEDDDERLKFILASYNAGRGHVLDAQRLTEKHGGDPQNWDDVAYWLLQKSKRSVYRDPVVRHGYVRGLEPVQYVSKILTRYDRYRNIDP